MTALLIDTETRERLVMLREVAAANPVDMIGLVDRLKLPKLKAAHKAQMTEQSVEIPASYLVVYSVETGHPIGPCRHMSMSTIAEGRLPNPVAVWMIAELLGFVGGLEYCTCWRETFATRGEAINVVQPLNAVDAKGCN